MDCLCDDGPNGAGDQTVWIFLDPIRIAIHSVNLAQARRLYDGHFRRFA